MVRNNRKKNATKRNAKKHKPNVSQKAVHALCAQSDPFCHHAIGARVPDGNNRNSVPFHFRSIVKIDPSTTGAAYFTAHPYKSDNSHYQLDDGVVTTLNYPATTGFSGSIGTMSTLFSDWRVVSAGVRFTRAQADDAPVGYLEISEVDNVFDVLDSAEHSPANFTHDATVTTLGSNSGSVTYIFDVGETGWDSMAVSGDTGRTPAIVAKAVSGDTATSSGTFYAEYVIHYEGVIDFGDTISTSLAGKDLPANPILMQWRKQADYAGAYLTGDPSFSIERKAKQFASYALRKGAALAANYLGGPIAGSTTYAIMDSIPEVD